ncbi:MAG: 3-oxoacyl-[acyl-carrier-protein] reductase [Phycisphaerae bacterium]|nr:3-oxoacyl-[acyl-carrier-protein] reductase [Phycisphaerae bacterium]
MERRVAIVTGASRGIGKAIAVRLARDGRHVVAVARNAEALADVVASITASGGSAEARSCDLADAAAFAQLVEDVASAHGRLDILVNNAGITRDGLILRMSDEDFDTVLAVNLRSCFAGCRAASRHMLRGKWGRIVNVGSVSGISGNAGQANYAAAKAGVIGLTKTIAQELGSKGITANVIAPGFISTDMTDALPQVVKDKAIEHIPARRFGTPDDIASACAYISSDEASYVTGHVLVVDGGMTM